MMKKTLVASEFIGKDTLNLMSGDFAGKIDGLLVAENPLSVAVLVLDAESGGEKQLVFCALDVVTDVGEQAVVISDVKAYLPDDEKMLLGLSCLDKNGKLMGKIEDFAWDGETHAVNELILRKFENRYGIATASVAKVGAAAVVLSAADAEIAKTDYGPALGAQAKESFSYGAEDVKSFARRLGESLSEAGRMISEHVKQIDTEELSREVGAFTDKMGKDLRNVITTIQDQAEAAKYPMLDSEVTSIMRDLNGYSVSTTIYDNKNQPIIVPGQVVSEDAVKRVVESDKIAELYRVAVNVKK